MRIDKDILRICIKSHGTITPTISSTGPIQVTLGAAFRAAELVEGRVDFLILVLKIWNDSGTFNIYPPWNSHFRTWKWMDD